MSNDRKFYSITSQIEVAVKTPKINEICGLIDSGSEKQQLFLEYHSDHLQLKTNDIVSITIVAEKNALLLSESDYAMSGMEIETGPHSDLKCISFGGLIGRFPIKSEISERPPNSLWYLYLKKVPAVSSSLGNLVTNNEISDKPKGKKLKTKASKK